jgi:hypothetical protein
VRGEFKFVHTSGHSDTDYALMSVGLLGKLKNVKIGVLVTLRDVPMKCHII